MIRQFKNYSSDELKEAGIIFGENVFIANDVIFQNAQNIIIGNNVRIDTQCILIAGENNKIIIGNNIHISAGCYFYGNSGDIKLEDFATISGKCILYTANDDYTDGYMTNPMVDIKYRKLIKGNITLKKHAIVGCSSVVLPNVVLEYATSVGANSLVTKSTNSFDLIAGNPAKFIKKRKNIFLN